MTRHPLRHLADFWDARRVGRELDPALPRVPISRARALHRFRSNALLLLGDASTLGPLVRLDLLYKPTVVAAHADAVQAVLEQPDVWLRGTGLVPLLTTNGATWRAHRDLVQPSFHPRMGEAATERFAANAADALGDWYDVVGTEIDAAHAVVTLFARHATHELGLVVRDAEARQLPEALLRLQRWGFNAVAGGARRTAQVRQDFALLDQILDRSLAAPPHDGPPKYVERLRQDHAVDRAHLRDHCLLALVAASDNPPNALAFTLRLLSRHPDVQEAVRTELHARVGHRVPTAARLLDLPLMERVIQESMRLYPPVWWLARIAQTDTELLGRRLPRGTMVFLHLRQVHRDPDAWQEPDAFRPDRFLPGPTATRHRYAYLPFGAGPRMCVGARLATLQMRAALVGILQRFRLAPAGPDRLPLEGKFALRSLAGVPVRLEAL